VFGGLVQGLVLSLTASLGFVGSFPVAHASTPAIQYLDLVCDLSSGTGTSGDPYLISTGDELWEVTDCTRVAGASAYFELQNNIDVSLASLAPTNSPIGFSSSSSIFTFSGVLEGNGYQINGLEMNRADGVGLFAYLHGATLRNFRLSGAFTTSATANDERNSAGAIAIRAEDGVTLQGITNSANVSGGSRVGGLIGFQIRESGTQPLSVLNSVNLGDIDARGESVGGLVGHSSWDLVITNSRNSGTISTGFRRVGGILGYKDQQIATITNVTNTATVSGEMYVGGIIGHQGAPATISGAVNVGRISGTSHVGGLVGGGYRLNIVESFNSGDVSAGLTSSFQNSGGLIGSLDTNGGNYRIEKSFNLGEVQGYQNVGGLLGWDGSRGGTLTFLDSYNIGTVSGTVRIGGLAGSSRDQNSHTRTYNSGTVTGVSVVDGFVASGSPAVISSYTLAASRLVSTSTVAQLQQASTYDNWNFSSIWGFGECTERSGLPLLRFAQEVAAYYSAVCFGATAVSAALTPTFGTPTKTADGFSVQVSNYDANYTWNASANVGAASIDGTGLVTLTGLSSGASATVTVTTTRSGHSNGSATLTETSVPSAQTSPPSETSAPAFSYTGPVIDAAVTGVAGTLVKITGKNLDSVHAVFLGNIPASISAVASLSLVIEVSTNSATGVFDLVVHSAHGVLTFHNGITVLASVIVGVELESVSQKITVGSFHGFVAIYSKGYMGSRLSTKIAGKWHVVPEVKENWEYNSLNRTLRFTGRNKLVSVQIYIDRELVWIGNLAT
jgi:hypothetical protein